MTYEYKNKITNRDLQKQPLRSRTWKWYMVVAQLTWQLPETLNSEGLSSPYLKKKSIYLMLFLETGYHFKYNCPFF